MYHPIPEDGSAWQQGDTSRPQRDPFSGKGRTGTVTSFPRLQGTASEPACVLRPPPPPPPPRLVEQSCPGTAANSQESGARGTSHTQRGSGLSSQEPALQRPSTALSAEDLSSPGGAQTPAAFIIKNLALEGGQHQQFVPERQSIPSRPTTDVCNFGVGGLPRFSLVCG